MFTIETTTDANILKFVSTQILTENKSYEFDRNSSLEQSPLAQNLFQYPFVEKVYVALNFVAIEINNLIKWDEVKSEVCDQLNNYMKTNQPIVQEADSKKIPLEVYAESTPNPSTMKFVANKMLVKGRLEFLNPQEAIQVPIIAKCLQFSFVKEVFVFQNYISITKSEGVEWEHIISDLRMFFQNNIDMKSLPLDKDILQADSITKASKSQVNKDELDEISVKIIELLEEHVEPAVSSDGGHISFHSYNKESNIVQVHLQGACSGCPSSTFTLKNGIETLLQNSLQEPNLTVEAIGI